MDKESELEREATYSREKTFWELISSFLEQSLSSFRGWPDLVSLRLGGKRIMLDPSVPLVFNPVSFISGFQAVDDINCLLFIVK